MCRIAAVRAAVGLPIGKFAREDWGCDCSKYLRALADVHSGRRCLMKGRNLASCTKIMVSVRVAMRRRYADGAEVDCAFGLYKISKGSAPEE